MNKTCRTCKNTKNINEFYKDKRYSDGHINNCKCCERVRTHKYRKQNPHKVSSTNANWYQKNKNRVDLRCSEYRKENKDKRKYWQANYRAAKLNATLPGFDKEIKEIYENCPEGYHVDHIMPLQGKDIKGLHVPWNLQYLPASENLKKSNKITKNHTQKRCLELGLIDEIDGEDQE